MGHAFSNKYVQGHSLGCLPTYVNVYLANRAKHHSVILSTNGKDLPEGYHLSGIGYMAGARNGQYLLACQDPDTACLGATRENSNTLRVSPVQHPFSNCVSKGSHLKGYPMHSRCWDLIEQRLGSLATSRLDLIVAALRKQWDEIIPRISRSSTSAAELSYNFGRYYQGLQHSYQVEDPMFIPPLNTLLQTCTDLSSANKGSRETISLNILGSKYNVPLEITYLIADCLSLRDTYNMLIAFGEKFPPNYWKRQIPTDILFELEKFDDNPFLWPYIAPKIESWGILNTYGIGNRKRILGMVDGIKRLVDTEVNKERIGKQQQNVAF